MIEIYWYSLGANFVVWGLVAVMLKFFDPHMDKWRPRDEFTVGFAVKIAITWFIPGFNQVIAVFGFLFLLILVFLCEKRKKPFGAVWERKMFDD